MNVFRMSRGQSGVTRHRLRLPHSPLRSSRWRRRAYVEQLEERRLLSASRDGVGSDIAAAGADEVRVIDFETLGATLAAESFWNGPDPNGVQRAGIDGDTVVVGEVLEDSVAFNNVFSQEFESWNGWAISNRTDSTTAGFQNQYSAFPGSGVDGSSTYAVAFRDTRDGVPWEDTYPLPTVELLPAADHLQFESLMVANTTYAALTVRDGDPFAKRFGGLSGDDPDWFLLTIVGKDRAGDSVGTIEFYLADFRFTDNSLDYIVDDWNIVDLADVANANRLEFKITSSDIGLFGINTPAFFALDNLVLATTVEAPLSVVSLVPTVSGFEAAMNQPFDPTTLNLYDSEAGAFGLTDVVLAGDSTGPVVGSLLIGPDADSIRFVRSGGVLPPDTYTVTLRSGTGAFQSVAGIPLDGDANGTVGDDFTTTFVIAPPAGDRVVAGLPDFARGPGQRVDLPAFEENGIPVTLSDTRAVRRVEMQIQFEPSQLEIQGADISPGLPDGTSVEFTRISPGNVRLEFFSPIDLPSGPRTILRLRAVVPAADADQIYRAVGLINMDGLSVRTAGDVTLPAVADDAIHVVSYFGDPSGNGRINSADAALVARVAAGNDSGFSALPRVDPEIPADITANGRLNGVDASRIAQFSALILVPEIPAIPGDVAFANTIVQKTASWPDLRKSSHPFVDEVLPKIIVEWPPGIDRVENDIGSRHLAWAVDTVLSSSGDEGHNDGDLFEAIDLMDGPHS